MERIASLRQGFRWERLFRVRAVPNMVALRAETGRRVPRLAFEFDRVLASASGAHAIGMLWKIGCRRRHASLKIHQVLYWHNVATD